MLVLVFATLTFVLAALVLVLTAFAIFASGVTISKSRLTNGKEYSRAPREHQHERPQGGITNTSTGEYPSRPTNGRKYKHERRRVLIKPLHHDVDPARHEISRGTQGFQLAVELAIMGSVLRARAEEERGLGNVPV